MSWIADLTPLWLILHLFAMVLGLGGATYSDILLVHFLRDLKISKKESQVIYTMSQVILVGIVLAAISGVLLFLPQAEELMNSSKFLAKSSIFLVLVINGYLLHRIILPKLMHFSFHKDHFLIKQTIHLRHLGFVMGAISFVSWYSIFILGAIKGPLPYSYPEMMGVYVLLLGLAIAIALLLERRMATSLK